MWPKGNGPRRLLPSGGLRRAALVLSGEVDPVTPPVWGESVVKHLSHGKHLIVPSTGHGVVMTPCGNRIVSDFIKRGSADGLDTDCVGDPFAVLPSSSRPQGPIRRRATKDSPNDPDCRTCANNRKRVS